PSLPGDAEGIRDTQDPAAPPPAATRGALLLPRPAARRAYGRRLVARLRHPPGVPRGAAPPGARAAARGGDRDRDGVDDGVARARGPATRRAELRPGRPTGARALPGARRGGRPRADRAGGRAWRAPSARSGLAPGARLHRRLARAGPDHGDLPAMADAARAGRDGGVSRPPQSALSRRRRRDRRVGPERRGP